VPKTACYPALPADPRIAVRSSDISLTAVLPGEAPFSFYEYWMPKDGDCGYHALGISRATATQQLLDNINNAEIRVLIAPEIEMALLAGDLPESMKKEEALQEMFQECLQSIAAQKVLDESVAFIKAKLGNLSNRFFAGLTAEQLSLKIEGESKLILDQLLINVQNSKKLILEFCQKTVVVGSYIRNHIARPGYFLTFHGQINGAYHSSSLDAIAKLNQLSVQVWGGSGPVLQLLHCYLSVPNDRLINMRYVPGHFNLLNSRNDLLIYPVTTQAWVVSQLYSKALKLKKSSEKSLADAKLSLGGAVEKPRDKLPLFSNYGQSFNALVQKLYRKYPDALIEIIDNLPEMLSEIEALSSKIKEDIEDNILETWVPVQLMKLIKNRNQAYLGYNEKSGSGYAQVVKCEMALVAFKQTVEQLFPCLFKLTTQYLKKYSTENLETFSKKLQSKIRRVINASCRFNQKFPTYIIETKRRWFVVCNWRKLLFQLIVRERSTTGYTHVIYEHHQLLNPNVPSHITLSGFESFILQIDRLGNIEISELASDYHFIFNLESDLILSGNRCIEGALDISSTQQVFNEGRYCSKECLYIQSEKLINRGLLESKTMTIERVVGDLKQVTVDNKNGVLHAELGLTIKAGRIDNKNGLLSASFLTLHSMDQLDNRKGKICLKNGGVLHVRKDVKNMRGIIETDLNVLKIISLQAKVELSELGYIRAWRGIVKIKAPMISTDESSLVHGAKGTALFGTKKLALDSVVSGLDVALHSKKTMNLSNGVIGYNTILFSGEQQKIIFNKPVLAMKSVSIVAGTLNCLNWVKAGEITIRVKNKLTYFEHAFVTNGLLSIYSEECLNMDTPLTVAGSFNLAISPNANKPFNILSNITVGSSGQSSNGHFSLYAPTVPVNVGNDSSTYIKIAAKGKVEFNTASFDLIKGKIIGQTGLSIISAGVGRVGRLESIANPSGLLSAGKIHIEAIQDIKIEGADIYGDESLVVRSPISVSTISSNIHSLGNAFFDTPNFTHGVLTRTTPEGARIPWSSEGAHIAYKTPRSKFEVLSRSSVLCVGKVLKIQGNAHILGSQVQHNGFEGLAPTITTLIPHDCWVLSVFGGHKKVKHAWWSHVNNQTFGTPVPAVFSSGAELVLKNTDINILGIVYAKDIKIESFQTGKIGLMSHNVLLSTPRPFKQMVSLLDHLRPNARYELTGSGDTLRFHSVLPKLFNFPLPAFTILNNDGSLSACPIGIKRWMPLEMEAELLIHSLMAELKRGFLEAENTHMHTIFHQLIHNAHQFLMGGRREMGCNVYGEPHWCLTLDKPILVYKRVYFDNTIKLSPYLILPKALNNPNVRDWAGGLYSFNNIEIQGASREVTTLQITAHMDAKGLINYSDLKTLLHEKNTYHHTQLVEDRCPKKRKFGMGHKTMISIRSLEEIIPQAGNTLIAEGIEFDNIDELVLRGVNIQTGSRGIVGKNLGKIIEHPVIANKLGLYYSSKGVQHFLQKNFVVTEVESTGAVELASENAYYHSVFIFAKKNINLAVTSQLNFGSSVVSVEMPVIYNIRRHRRLLQWNCIEKGTKVSIHSQTGNIHCLSSEGNIGCRGTEMSARHIALAAKKGIVVEPLVLKQTKHTLTSGIKGFRKYRQTISENHEYGISSSFFAHESITLSADTSNILLIAPFIYAEETLTINTPLGNITVKPVAFKHDLTRIQQTRSLSFFSSGAIEAMMRRDFKQAALALVREFPLLGSIEQLVKSKDAADRIGNGLMGLYHWSKTISQFYSSDSFKDFLNSQISFNQKIRFGSGHTLAAWTDLVLPWLYVKNIILKAKDIQMESAQLEAQTVVLEADNNIDLLSDVESKTLKEINRSLSVGWNSKALMPTVSIDYAEDNASALKYIHSHLNIAKIFKGKAGGTISLRGVYVKTQQAILEAEHIHLETIQDVELTKGKSTFASSNMSFTAAKNYQSTRWSSEQTGIEANKCLLAHARQQLNLRGAKLALTASSNPLIGRLPDGTSILWYEFPFKEGVSALFPKTPSSLNIRTWSHTLEGLRVERTIEVSPSAPWLEIGYYPESSTKTILYSQPGIVRSPALRHSDVVDIDKGRYLNVGIEAGGLFFDKKNRGFKGAIDIDHRSYCRQQINRSTVAGNVEVVTETPVIMLHRESRGAREIVRNSSHHHRAVAPLGSAKDIAVELNGLKQSPTMLKLALSRHMGGKDAAKEEGAVIAKKREQKTIS
jgi:adhesin HecA-like repeat protein